MKRDPNGDRDGLLWQWARGAATSRDEFADPLSQASYAFCLYDARGGLLGARAPAGAARWRALGEIGFAYRDQARTGQGLQKILLKGNGGDRAKIIVKAGGSHLPAWPAGPLAPEVVAQLVNEATDLCWEGRYAVPDVVRNEPDLFKATALP